MNKYLIIKNDSPQKVAPGERGMALLLTLLVTIILSVVILEFNYLMRVHATLSGNLVDDLQAQSAARGGIEKAKALLLNDLSADNKKGNLCDTLQEDWAGEITLQTPAWAAETKITDEMSKLNLNRLVKGSANDTEIESVNREMEENVKHLFELLNYDPNLVDCIIDWIDENDQEESFGAENAYYQSLEHPIQCKNGPLDSIEELLLVKGFDAKILYGDEENPGLAAFVTVFGDPRGLININTADEKVLSAALNSESVASMIVDMRENEPFDSETDMAARLPEINLKGKFATGSSYFLVTSKGRVPAAADMDPVRQVTIKTLLKRVMPEGIEIKDNYLEIATAYWKVER
jgi:general secretion pathway protein K